MIFIKAKLSDFLGMIKGLEDEDNNVDKAAFENKLKELASEFGASSNHYDELEKAAKAPHDELKDFDHLEDSLDFLRICIKYLRFDLESTRKENRYLRKLLEEIED